MLLVFQGVPVGLPAGSAKGFLLIDSSAMIQSVAPPTSSCSGQLPVGVWYYFGGVLCIDFFLFFQNHVRQLRHGSTISVVDDDASSRHSSPF